MQINAQVIPHLHDAEFLAVAEVTFCEPVNNYYFLWNISGLSSDIYENYFNVKSNYLQLPAGTLMSEKSYDLSVVLFNNESLSLGSVIFFKHLTYLFNELNNLSF